VDEELIYKGPDKKCKEKGGDIGNFPQLGELVVLVTREGGVLCDQKKRTRGIKG